MLREDRALYCLMQHDYDETAALKAMAHEYTSHTTRRRGKRRRHRHQLVTQPHRDVSRECSDTSNVCEDDRGGLTIGQCAGRSAGMILKRPWQFPTLV
jgi:hypothetical protein